MYMFMYKYMYCKYLSFATLKRYVACLWAKVFKFPWRVRFGGFLAEVEQRAKLVSAHPQIPLWLEKSAMMLNGKFCFKFFFVIVIFKTVSRKQRQTYNCHSSFLKIFDPIPHHHTFNFFTNQKAPIWLLLVL